MIDFGREAGDARAALDYAERLAKLTPDDAAVAKLIDHFASVANCAGRDNAVMAFIDLD